MAEAQDEAASAVPFTRSDSPARSSSSSPLPPMSTYEGANLSDSLGRLTLDTDHATRSPDSPQTIQTHHGAGVFPSGPPHPATGPTHSPLRRSASSLSVDRRSANPSLNKKSSVSSLQGVGGVTPPRPSSRRSSYNVGSSLAGMPSKPLDGVPDESMPPSPPTAASLANSSFQTELELHSQSTTVKNTGKTVVVVHDSCYGHRFSRPRTSKASLATIVERPERIHASVLGVSTAYVRLGGRHAEGKHPPRPRKNATLHDTIPFSIQKSRRTVPLSSPIVTNVHGMGWMEELKVMCETAEAKLNQNGKELARPSVEGQEGEGDTRPKLHEGDLYLCGQSLDALEGSLGAVCDGVDSVFQGTGVSDSPKRAFVCIRPPGHHCSSSYPSGFCWLNTVHVGISHASMAHGLTHAAIIDFDLHHGDGSQAITWAHNAKITRLPKNAPNSKKSPIGYFSLHDINSYPCEWGDDDKVRNASLCVENAHGQTIWNVHLQPWKSENEFWELYESRYSVLLDKARAFLRTHSERLRASNNSPAPKAAIFISAGFDASEWEGAGMQRHKVNVPTDFYARISQDIVKLSEEEGLGVDGRVISVLEGGYSDRALSSGVLSHVSGLAGGAPPPKENIVNGLGHEMGKKLAGIDGALRERSSVEQKSPLFDPAWWALTRLEQLEALTSPPPAPSAPKKKRNATPPTYTTPTQSFAAKVVSSPKPYRSVSGQLQPNSPRSPSNPSRPVSPPPPDVDWATAAHELSKLLIPSDRQTKSCRPEELSVEASRARRQQQHSNGVLAEELEAINGKRMTLRDRKSRAPSYATNEEDERSRSMSRANRRKTVAGMDLVIEKNEGESEKLPAGRPRRRSSMASSTTSIGGDTSSARRDGPPAGGPRPGSAMSSRISSAGKTNATTAAPRKARVAPQTQNARARASKSTTPVDQQPPVPTLPAASAGEVGPNGENREMDNLASSMTRIKLNVPSKEEHDARAKQKSTSTVVEQKPAPARPGRKPAAPKTTTAKTSKPRAPAKGTTKVAPSGSSTGAGKIPPNNQREGAISQAAKTEPTDPPRTIPSNPPTKPAETQDPISAPLLEAHSRPQTPTQEIPPAAEFIPYIPSSPPAPNAAAPQTTQEPLTWLPPNTSTPVRAPSAVFHQQQQPPPPAQPMAPPPPQQQQPRPPSSSSSTATTPSGGRKRSDLPTFTSSSPIPFREGFISREALASRPLTANGTGVGSRPGSGPGSDIGNKEDVKKEQEREMDIWTMPETPANK
ncbi:MAG: hypothetical protein M4579_001796 [Chaenotheca gracillima]|nr:MAG: hypothetical protein M4579_001796 [Chaenotheca gracillima]